jgi:hypothetical protein
MVPAAPAIANAINDALGIRFNGLPLSAEKIFLALEAQKQKEEWRLPICRGHRRRTSPQLRFRSRGLCAFA